MTTQIWIHRPSGCLYAVALERHDSYVVEASDDLTQNDVEDVLITGFDSNPETADWVNEHTNEFDLYAYRVDTADGKVVFNY